MVTLTSARLYFREFEWDDWRLLYRWSRDPGQTRFDGAVNVSRLRAIGLVEGMLSHQYSVPRMQYDFVLLARDNSRTIGSVYAALRPGVGRRVEIGYRIEVTEWNRGYATEAARMICDFACQVLHPEQLYARVIVDNVASVRVLEKLGMQQVSVQPHGVQRDGIVYALATYTLDIVHHPDCENGSSGDESLF